MGKWNLRKYCYVLLWLGLILSVGLVWVFGGGKQGEMEKENAVSLPDPALSEPSANEEKKQEEEETVRELAGVWVPYFSLETDEHTREAFEENYRKIVDMAKDKGLNALFVHVRPFCDALYPSQTYPWSHILTGKQGKDPGFDPLEFMVEYAHRQGMEFHAWLNPLRVKTSQTPGELAENSPYTVLREDHPYYFMEFEGGVYLDPAYPYVRSLIAEGAAEIVRNYPVDGIHFDDYFYPAQEEELDREAYELYTASTETPLSLLEWRRANISAMVEEVYGTIKAENEKVIFGISPQGNIENDENMGADVRTWCGVKGYVDYLCPQLYYSFENEALGYSDALKEWMALPRHKDLKLYAGLALYKAGSDADGGTWLLSDDTIQRQIEAAREAACAGVVLYSSDYLEAEQTREEVENAIAALAGARA